jgi:hypothetical protein
VDGARTGFFLFVLGCFVFEGVSFVGKPKKNMKERGG